MALTSPKNGKAHVLEISNRANIQTISTDAVIAITDRITNHESSLNTNAHQISNVFGLQLELDSKEPSFTKNTAFNKNFGTTTGTVCQGNDSRLSDARTPLAHTHTISDIVNLQNELNNKANTFTGYNGSIDVVTDVNFTSQTITKKTINITNGIVTSVV